MKKIISIVLASILFVFAGVGFDGGRALNLAYASTISEESKVIAEKLINDLGKGNYKAAAENYTYDENMKKVITAEQCMIIMETKKLQYGEFKKVISIAEEQKANYKLVNMAILTENAEYTFTVVFNEKNEIAGFNFSRPKALDDPAFNGENIVFGGDKFKLNGVLNLPEGKTDTLVIIVHGSGANDRNLTLGPNKPYLDIAKDLTSKGIATFRYDKRSYTYGAEIAAMDITPWDETIEDALYAVKYFRDKNQFSKIYILGHSLGGFLIPMMDEMSKEVKIDGYISLAGSVAIPLEDLVVYQIEYQAKLDGIVSSEETAALQEVTKQRDRIKTLTADSKYGPQDLLGITKGFWLALKNYKPIEQSKKLTKPVLVLNGSRDYQVPAEQFNMYKDALEGKINYTFKLYDGLNHLFLKGIGIPNPNEYFIKSKVDGQVTEDIANWIKANNLNNIEAKEGWNLINDAWYYLDSNGFKKVGWASIEELWYYFNADGTMKTDWVKYNNTWYYLKGNGAMKTGWLRYDGQWYYLDKSGAMITGWKLIDNKWYYFTAGGAMVP